MFLAIDTDILLYRSALSAETEIEWSPDVWTLYMDMNEAKEAFKSQLKSITVTLQSDEVLYCLSDRNGNFRKQVDPTYKANRKGTRKPVGYTALVDWVISEYKTQTKPLLEADDVLAITSTSPEHRGKCVVVSDDKDLLSCPGKLYRPTTGQQLDITDQEADKFFLTQVLCGDTADGYKGVPGIGPKKAEAILGSRPHWGAVQKAFINAGMTADDAIRQARLARILRWEDYDEEKGEPILWQPKSQT